MNKVLTSNTSSLFLSLMMIYTVGISIIVAEKIGSDNVFMWVITVVLGVLVGLGISKISDSNNHYVVKDLSNN